jgi:hypothetical protein
MSRNYNVHIFTLPDGKRTLEIYLKVLHVLSVFSTTKDIYYGTKAPICIDSCYG